jgi:hypothetical protein
VRIDCRKSPSLLPCPIVCGEETLAINRPDFLAERKALLPGSSPLGILVMSVREGLEFESEIASDSVPLHDFVAPILAYGIDIHVLRDPTLAAA